MSAWIALVLLYYYVTLSYVVSDPVSVPCKIGEADCLKKLFANMYTKIIDGDPALGAEALDPMYHDEINGNWSFLKFKMTNTTVTGFKDCLIEDVKVNPETITLNVELVCPKLAMNGKYDIHGQLLAFPLEGNGDFTITSNKYKISVEIVLTIDHGSDGKTYFTIKGFKQTSEPLESVKYDFKNLFNGQKELADAVRQFANENWYAVAKAVQDPVFKANIKKLVKNVNKYYKKQPIDEFISL